MLVNGETKSQPIADKAGGVCRMYFTFVTEQEEPWCLCRSFSEGI